MPIRGFAMCFTFVVRGFQVQSLIANTACGALH